MDVRVKLEFPGVNSRIAASIEAITKYVLVQALFFPTNIIC